MEFNSNIINIAPSKSIAMSVLAKELKKTDPDIVDLSIGEPDFDTPAAIVDEAIKWLKDGFTHYTTGPGLPELRERIAKKLKDENGIDQAPNGIIFCTGGKFAIYLALATLLNAGDEVIVLAPYWVSYPSITESLGAVPVTYELKSADRYRIHEDELRALITDKTRMIIINYPSNPTGMILNTEDYAALKNIMMDYPDLLLMSDEMYERILFDGNKNISPAADPDIKDRVITINGFSKSVAMTGWRAGYMAASTEIAKVAARFFGHTLTQTAGFIQKACVVALDQTEDIEKMRQSYEKRRELFVNGLNSIPGIKCMKPDGSFYAWTGFDDELLRKLPGYVEGKKEQSEIISEFLLRQGKVSSVPGIANGVTEGTFVRFCFAASEENLNKAIRQIEAAVKAL
ncbi:MAG: pyridoxal phosphate-dependent aminotransferase [Eubacteriales bacterium]|nr:pyridoxal phosphate-dependent aminotransferase [Eubacteriales bacterium]